MKISRSRKFSQDQIGDYIAQAASTVFTLENQLPLIQEITTLVVSTLKRKNTLFSCGNGGSAAEALHLAEELTGKYKKPRRALPGICLAADVTALTCIANDWDYAHIFARQIEALAKKGDVLVLFTTSGNSANCVAAAKAMKKVGGKTIGLLGNTGGKAKAICDLSLVVDSPLTNHIQEAHQVILHLILEAVEAEFA